MRAVARLAGVTDAGVAHHFGNRDGLLSALLDHGARKVRNRVSQIVAEWLSGAPDVSAFASMLGALYADGYAALALELHRSGWRDVGDPLLDPVAASLTQLNRNPSTTEADIRAALASLHMVLALDPLFGSAFRQSAGLAGDAGRAAQLDWWSRVMTSMLEPANREPRP